MANSDDLQLFLITNEKNILLITISRAKWIKKQSKGTECNKRFHSQKITAMFAKINNELYKLKNKSLKNKNYTYKFG